ncbi:VanW family protein [Anaerotignum sp.]|uniref:VanW family protein n=1 Tax=Anaerotignum sp. TaxID=2039241 RepID=UPI002714CA61|nr:VanW family protein [Anaerotignum sp.]
MGEKNEGNNLDNRPKKAKAGIFVGLIILCLCFAGGYFVYANNQNQKIKDFLAQSGIYDGITIDGIDVGGLSKEEATDLLNTTYGANAASQKLVFFYDDEEWPCAFQEIGAEYQVNKAVNLAYNLGRTGTEKEKTKVASSLLKHGEEIPLEFTYDEMKLQDKLIEVADEFEQEPQNSTMTRSGGKFVITEEAEGRKMNLEGTMLNVESVLESKKGGRVAIVADTTQPEITYEDNQYVTDLIGSYSTKYTAYDQNRNTNLEVGCNYLNGTMIAPGEVFSAMEGLGEQTYARGYRNAGVYVNGKVEAGMGGGVCQITTTLYNAAIYAELEIVERYPHSMTVGYVPLGRDAAVADTYKDLKIRNNTEYPVYLEASAINGVLEVSLYGHEAHDSRREVEFQTVYEGTIAKPDEIVTEDPEKPEGEREITHNGRTGAKVSVYKIVRENGEQVSKEWFSSSSYRAVADEVTVGTKITEPENKQVDAIVPQEPQEMQEPQETQEPQEEIPVTDFVDENSFGIQ